VQMAPTGPPQVWGTVDEYIYGLDYIDEHVAYYEYENWNRSLILTDASHNVVAVVEGTGDDGPKTRRLAEPSRHGSRYWQ